MADQHFRLQFFHRFYRLVQRDMPTPMEQIEIEVICLQVLKGGAAMALCLFGRRVVRHDFTDEKRILPPFRHNVSDQRFGLPNAVNLGGIRPAQPIVKSGDLLLVSHPRVTEGPRAHTERRNARAPACFHSRLLHRINGWRVRRQSRA